MLTSRSCGVTFTIQTGTVLRAHALSTAVTFLRAIRAVVPVLTNTRAYVHTLSVFTTSFRTGRNARIHFVGVNSAVTASAIVTVSHIHTQLVQSARVHVQRALIFQGTSEVVPGRASAIVRTTHITTPALPSLSCVV